MTEDNKRDMLYCAGKAIDLMQVFNALTEGCKFGGDSQFTLEISVCDGSWRVIVIRHDKDDVEGCGWSLEEAIIATLPYLDE